VDRRENLRKLAKKDEESYVRKGGGEILIHSKDPREVAKRARRVVEGIGNLSGSPKDFKHSQGKSNSS